MARELGKPGDVMITLHSVDLPLMQHGLVVQDGWVAEVSPGSPAEKAGVQVGDMLAKVGGQNVLHCNDDTVRALMAQRPLSLQLGRPHPPPYTTLEKRKALGALQAKLSSGTGAQTVQSYKAAVGSALQAAQDVLGSLGLDPGPPGVGQAVQEVEVNCYDSDSLSSPPASSGEESEGEIDPLLDFSREDEFTHLPEKPMIFNVLKTQQALGGLKAITHDIQEAKQQKAADEERQRAEVLVATEATFTPTFKGGMSTQLRTMPELRVPQKPELTKQLPSVTTQRQSKTGNAKIQSRTQPDTLAEQLPGIATQRQNETGTTSPPPTALSRMEPRAMPEVRMPRKPQPLPSVVPYRRKDKQIRDITTQEWNRTSPPPAEISRRQPSSSEDLPPPVPPYNPHGPEQHVWSNKPRERPQPVRVPLLRGGRKKSREDLPTTAMSGHVTDRAYKKQTFSPPPIQPTLPESVHDWQMKEVGVWLKRLDLYEKYFPLFCKHDITGPTVMRLSEAKLKSMGITHTTHRKLLAMEATRLKIQQEALELRELEEETEITYL